VSKSGTRLAGQGTERPAPAAFAATLRRHLAYRAMHRRLAATSGSRTTYFFAAAAAVTGWSKLGGAELASRYVPRLGVDRLSAASMARLGELGAELYAQINLPLFRQLSADAVPSWLAGVSGRSRDQAIIHREQAYVETWLADLPAAPCARLLDEADLTLTRSRCPAVRKALQRIGRPFSFADQAHREAVGLALADRARAARSR
jgi:hypothetical protein